MICNFCQKVINGKEVRVKRGFLKLDRTRGRYAYSPAFYHKGCYFVISGKRKKEQKRGLIFFALTIFLVIGFLILFLNS